MRKFENCGGEISGVFVRDFQSSVASIWRRPPTKVAAAIPSKRCIEDTVSIITHQEAAVWPRPAPSAMKIIQGAIPKAAAVCAFSFAIKPMREPTITAIKGQPTANSAKGKRIPLVRRFIAKNSPIIVKPKVANIPTITAAISFNGNLPSSSDYGTMPNPK